MKKIISLLLALTVLLSMAGCGADPAETTLPSQTTQPSVSQPIVPESTTPSETLPPETTEPPVPSTHLNLNQHIAGSDITMTIDGETVVLSEDGLTVEFSINSREVYRGGYIMGLMMENPILEDGVVYIREDFFRYFFCKEGSEEVSLFHGVLFFPEEIRSALEHGEESPFNTKMLAQVCLPTSMGIQIPRIEPGRVFQDTPLSELNRELTTELQGCGYFGNYTYSEYTVIVDTLTGKINDRSDEDAIHPLMREDQVVFFEEKQIQLDDFWYLYKWFYGDFTSRSDEELIACLETCYRSNLLLSLGWEYPEG